MATKIVLVRHGKAEPRGAVVPDSLRRLTAKGKARLEKSYPEYFCGLLDGGEPISIVSSSAVRCTQTAAVICRILGMAEDAICVLDSLTNQNEDAIISDLRHRAGIVVAVGHSPSIDEVASRMSGHMRSVVKGEALCLDAGGPPSRMPLLWDCIPTRR